MIIQNQAVRLILAKCDTGAGKKGAENGPEALLAELKKLEVNFDDVVAIEAESVKQEATMPWCKHIETVSNNATRLSNAVIESATAGKMTFVFSGDHSNAIGGFSGYSQANPDKTIGVIWIDAHADLHSPYTTPSGNMHGMPLAALIGADNSSEAKNALSDKEVAAWNALKNIGVAPHLSLQPSNIVFIAIRDAEPQEWHLIDQYNIKNFKPDFIKEHGIYNVIDSSLKHLQHCDRIYVSFDVDSMDPSLANGTGTPVTNGLSKTEAEAILKTLVHLPKTGLVEITEINPSLDTQPHKMAVVTAEILASALKG